MLCFLHEHFSLFQSVRQLHLIMHTKHSGAEVVMFKLVHMLFQTPAIYSLWVRLILSIEGTCTLMLRYFVAAEVGGQNCRFA